MRLCKELTGRTISERLAVSTGSSQTDRRLRTGAIFGRHTRASGVRAAGVDPPQWVEDFPICRILNQYRILHVGIQSMTTPFKLERRCQTTTYFLASFGGRGPVLTDGPWRTCKDGSACISPPQTLNAFEALPGVQWEYCWVCYQPQQQALAGVASPVVGRFDSLPLRHAILGLMHECSGFNQTSMVQTWADLIHSYVLRFARSWENSDRLCVLWDRVAFHLSDEWTIERLKHESGYSYEHLRRICRRQLGRSPCTT